MSDIVLKNISKAYNGIAVFDRFSAVIPHGSITAVMGPSGCGKTTLVNMLLGLAKFDSGEISGVPEKLSAVFQEDRLCEVFSPQANIRLVTGKSKSDEEITRCLTALGLQDALDRPVSQLSGGMKRRVSLARALLAEYGLLVLDEPFKGLDPDTRSMVMAYVKAQTSGKTVILVTHDEREAETLSQNIIRL